MENKEAWVVIPAYNEEKTISTVIKKTKEFIKNIIVVDDGSKDKTYEIASNEKVVVLRHIINMGKGATLNTGCEYAIKHGAKAIIAMDADGQHNPEEIPNFINALEDNDIVFGCRKLDNNMPIIMKLGNLFINLTLKFLYGIKLQDTQCGYRAFTTDAYKKIKWKAQDYSMESEMITNISKNNLKYKEIPIATIYANKYKGTTIFDGIKIVFNMLLWKTKK